MSKPRYRCCEHCADDSPHPATIGHGIPCKFDSCPGVVRLATPPSSPASERCSCGGPLPCPQKAGINQPSKSDRLAHLMNNATLVKVTNPAFPDHPWVGTIIAIADTPSILLDTDVSGQEGSFRVTLPQAFVVEPATMSPSSAARATERAAGPPAPPDLQRPTGGRDARWLDALTLSPIVRTLEQCRVEIVSRAMALADVEGAALWERLKRARIEAERMTADAVKDGALIADLQTGLADANATIERVQSLLGDTAGPLWSVRGVCEANLQAALNRRAQ